MWGPIIAAGATLAGGLLSARGARQTQRREDTAIQRRMQDATRSGVHPVYALNASGASSSAPAPSTLFGDAVVRSGQAIGNAVSRSLDTDGRAAKTLLLEKAGLENELLRTQITRAKTELVNSNAPSAGIPGQRSTMLPDRPPGALPHKLEDPTFTPNLHVGLPYKTNPFFSDAQTIQNRYGELAESIYGGVTIPADALYNARSTRFPNSHSESGAWGSRRFTTHAREWRRDRDWRNRSGDHGLY